MNRYPLLNRVLLRAGLVFISVWLASVVTPAEGSAARALLFNSRRAASCLSVFPVRVNYYRKADEGDVRIRRLLDAYDIFVRADLDHLRATDGLVDLFQNRNFVPDHGRVLILGGSLNFYEILLPLVNPSVTVFYNPAHVELFNALRSEDWYFRHMLRHVKVNNRPLWRQLGRPSEEEFRRLFDRRVVILESKSEIEALHHHPADLIFSRDPKRFPAHLEDLLVPGGFYWIRVSEHSAPIPSAVQAFPFLLMNSSEVARIADFAQRRVPGGARLDEMFGYTGAEEFPGVTLLFMKPH